MNRRSGLSALTVLAVLAGAACSEDDTGPSAAVNFNATLTGAAERPNPVTTTSTGTGSVVINEAAQSFTVNVNVTGVLDVTNAHIHVGDANTAGPIAVGLLPTPPATGTFTGTLVTGTFSTIAAASGETFATLVAKMRAGNTYINVHNAVNTGGVIRGQLVAQ